jgi:hypothetical protein
VSIPFVQPLIHTFISEHWCSIAHYFNPQSTLVFNATPTNMKFLLSALLAASAATLTNAHGYFTSPKARQPGPVFEAACGQQAYDNMAADINGNIQGLQQITANQPDYNPKQCHLWKCKGMKYADNTANVQHYSPGQTVAMNFDIVAPHDGYANVSIIGLRDDNVLATLKSWKQYALTSIPIKPGWEKFSVKMPSSLGSQCAQPGHCAIQMFWNAPSIDQTYESCIDITLGGGAGKRDTDGVGMEARAHARDFRLD